MKIVIVGGGTAGWTSAASFKKHTNYSDITLIESSKIGIIGAGEGSTGTLPWFIKEPWPDGSITEIDFLKKTKGTLKLGIKLKNWKGDGGYIYSPFHGSPTETKSVDSALFGSILKYGRADYSSLHSWLMDYGVTNFKYEFSGKPTAAVPNYSYHFDGHEVGKYFKDWSTKRGVKWIDSEVVDTNFGEDGYLKSIKLSNGAVIEGDLWLDCSGFSRVLMSKTDNKWISYKNHLPTNSAIPFNLPISSKNVNFYTLAEAMNSGWMWQIPLQNRYGSGYVYCDEFQSYDESVIELEKKLKTNIEPIKHIKFEPGRYENTFHKNIVAIGLSSHFLEPLQATAIHISFISAANLMFHFLKGEDVSMLKNEDDKKSYNKFVAYMIDDYKDFIQMHYLAGRSDTPFWKFVTNELEISDRNQQLIDISKYRAITIFDINQTHGTPGYPLWVHILDNSGLFNKDIIEKELHHYKKYDEAFDMIRKLKIYGDKAKSEFISNEEFFKYLKI